MPTTPNADAQRFSIPKRLSTCLLVCSLTCHALGCSNSSVERNYTKIVEVDGRAAMRIQCEYVGKQPGDPSTYVAEHDFEKIDTDFYRITIENLTDKDFVIERVQYRLETGPVRGHKSASADSIKRTWGTNIVPAKSRISRANNMVWSTSSRNSLLKTYYFQVPGSRESIQAEIHLVYQR
ncbi:MAG TPA: hypothetical protein EYQ63_09735 [Fuerstia sp.]|nr:hypothetical protein [Fuerstiella sp.]